MQAGRRRLDGERLEQVGPLDLGVAIRQLQRPPVVRGRLPVGAGGGRGPGRERRDLDEGVVVACPFGVMHQPGRIGATGLQRGAARGRAAAAPATVAAPPRPPGGPARAGTPRPHRATATTPRSSAAAAASGQSGHTSSSSPVSARAGTTASMVQQRPGGLRQPRHPGQHGLAHRGGQPLLLGGEQLGDEERVAAGRGVHAQARSRVARQLRDRVAPTAGRARSAPRPAPADRPAPAAAARPRRHLVVAIGEHQQRAQPLDAAGDEGQRVEAGVVGPVHVLDDHYRRRTAGLAGARRAAR